MLKLKAIILILFSLLSSVVWADLSMCDVQIEGPTVVCDGDINTYTIVGIPPGSATNVYITMGAIGTFFFDDLQTITLQMFDAIPTATLCIDYVAPCGSGTVCIDIIVLSSLPSYTLTGDLNVCGGEIVTYNFSPSILTGVDVDFSIQNGTVLSSDENGVTIEWSTSATNGEVCALINNPCGQDQNLCLQVDIIDPPISPTLSITPDLVCIGETLNLSIVPSNYPTIEWSVTNATLLTPDNNPNVSILFDQEGIANICVKVGVGCNNDVEVCRLVNVSLPPNPTLSAEVNCSLEALLLAEDIVPGSEMIWEQINGPGNLTIFDKNYFITNVLADAAGIYRVSFTETVGNCTVTKELEFEVTEPIKIENITFNCTNQNGYRVRFEILGGTFPLLVNGVEIPNRNFSSGLIPFGQPYSFIIEDLVSCQLLIEGEADCPCTNSAGTMKQNQLTACDNLVAIAVTDSNSVVGNGYIGVFILHDSPSDTLGKIYAVSSTPMFQKNDSMIYGRTYFISYVVSNELNGEINLNANCLDASKGQPVIFYKSPVIMLVADSAYCGNSASFNLKVDSLNSIIKWEIVSPYSGSIASVFDSTHYLVKFTADDFQNHMIAVQATNNGCVSNDTINFTLLENPIVSGINIECNATASQYTVSCYIDGGNSPYFFNSVELLDSTYTSLFINSGSPFEFVFTDSKGCTTDTLKGLKNCNCLSFAGRLMTDTIISCIVDTIQIEISNDFILDGNDTYFYILHDGNESIVGNIYEFNQSGQFVFNQNLLADKTYFISRVVGDTLNGFVNINDLCINYSNGQPIMFLSKPLLPMIIDDNHCQGQVEIIFMEEYNYNYQIKSLSNDIGIQESNNSSIKLFSNVAGVFQLELSSDNLICSSVDTIDILINANPIINNINYICSDDNTSYTATLYNSSNQLLYVGNDTLVDSITYLFPSNGIENQLIISSDEGCTSYISIDYNCSCTSSNGSMASDTIKVCGEEFSINAMYLNDGIEDGDTSFYILHTSPDQNIGNVIISSNQASFQKNDFIEYGKVYYISYINIKKAFLNNLDDPCISIAKGQPIIFNFIPFIDLETTEINCENKSLLNVNSNGDYIVDFINGPANGEIIFQEDTLILNLPGLYLFSLISINHFCRNQESFNIQFNDTPRIASEEVDCIGDKFQFQITIEGGTMPYLYNNSTFTNSVYQSPLLKSDSIVYYKIRDNNGCETEERTITKNCSCVNNAGIYSMSDTTLCLQTDFIIPMPNGIILQDDAGINYQLIVDVGNGKDSIIQLTGNFIRFEQWFIDKEIIIKTLVGKINQNGLVDLQDDCLSIGDSLIIKWKNLPVLNTIDEINTCNLSNLTLPITLTGTLPFEVVLEWSNKEINILIEDSTDVIDLNQLEIKDYSTIKVTSIKDRYCKVDLNKSILIEDSKDWTASVEPLFLFSDTLNMEVNFTSTINGDYDVEWIFENKVTLKNNESNIKITQGQIGNTIIIINDENGCIDTLFTVSKIELLEEEIEVVFPNIIIPNDPVQGLFTINNTTNILNVDYFRVYDRWGNLVYNVINQKPESLLWKGQCLNGECMDGVYIFLLQWTDLNGKSFTKLADITIINE